MLILWYILKIGGVVNDKDEAKEVEEIIKVFLIKQRINNLSSVDQTKKINNPDLNFMKKISKDYKILKNSKIKKDNRKKVKYNSSN